MKQVYLLLLVSVWLGFASGCQQGNGEKNIIEDVKPLLNQTGFSVKPVSTVVNDQLVLLAGEPRGLVFYEIGTETILSAEKVTNQWLQYDGKNLYAFWWSVDETKGKFLKVRVSSDAGKNFSPEVVINNDTGVLPDLSIAADGKGAIAIAYTDERKPGYGVYVNASSDGGLTWSKQDTRLDAPVITAAMQSQGNIDPATFANSPKLAYVQDRFVVVWQQIDVTEGGQSELRFVSRASTDKGLSWGAEVTAFRGLNMQPAEMVAFNNASQFYVFAMLPEEEKGFTGFYTETADKWSELDNKALGLAFNKRLVSWIKGAFSGDNLVLAFTSKTDGQSKVAANVATLSTKTHQWLAPVVYLDADKGHDLTKSTYPDVIDAGKAVVLVVWEDYRTIVPSVYMNISHDNGQSWLEKPLPLTTPSLSVNKEPRLVLGKDKLWMTYFMVRLNSANPAGQRVYQEFERGENGDFKLPEIKVAQYSPDELREKLIKRVNEFWVLREERKWEETWDYMEPVYRERFDKAQWLAQQGKISFSKTVVDENSVVIKGNLGILDAKVDVSVNQQVSKEGLLESAPPKEQTVEMKWGWFYDDWYFMPNIIFGNHLEYD